MTISHRKETLLNVAADGGNKEVFDTVVELLDGAVRVLLSTIRTGTNLSSFIDRFSGLSNCTVPQRVESCRFVSI